MPKFIKLTPIIANVHSMYFNVSKIVYFCHVASKDCTEVIYNNKGTCHHVEETEEEILALINNSKTDECCHQWKHLLIENDVNRLGKKRRITMCQECLTIKELED